MNQVVIALGSNIDKERNLPAAVQLLAEMGRVTAVSPVYETAPVGTLDQPAFFNAAVLLETELDAAQIKDQMIGAVEQALQRVRQADKNAPRTIDADIVLFNDAVGEYVAGDGRSRRLPEPDLRRFRHVAQPVADLLPEMPHPETGERLAVIAQRLRAAASAAGEPPLRSRPDISLKISR